MLRIPTPPILLPSLAPYPLTRLPLSFPPLPLSLEYAPRPVTSLTRADLRHLGQTTTTARSTLSQVRARIAALRAQTASKVTSKNYDFASRLQAVRAENDKRREERREERKRKREEGRVAEENKRGRRGGLPDSEKKEGQWPEIGNGARVSNGGGVDGGGGGETGDEEQDMMAMMGFGGFGSTKR